MQRLTNFVVTMALVLLSNQLLADLPGGDNQFAATIRVYDQNGDPYPNIPLQLFVDTEGPWGQNICVETGTTDGQGYCYLQCLVNPNFSEQLNFMQVTITTGYYAIIESENTTTTTQAFIFPVFDIGYDANYNDVVDVWEMALAQKFCPVLFAPKEDRGLLFGVSNGFNTLRPVPAQIMDIDGPNDMPDGKLTFHDVYVEVTNTNGQFVGEWEMEELTVGGLPYSSFYPERVHHNHKILNFTPPDKAPGVYILHPHFEWAMPNLPEDNDVWYGVWEQVYTANPQDTYIRDGTVYVAFANNNSDITIEYRTHYPFNASSGRHEGDWPNLKVIISSQDPDDAQILSVSYPFHGFSTLRTNSIPYNQSFAESFFQEEYDEEGENHAYGDSYFVIDSTHPVSFTGGRIDELGILGYGSHPHYPLIGTWIREVTVFQEDVEEYVVENGSISNETVQIDFNGYQNLIIIPPKSYILNNLIDDPDFNWLVFGGYWGHRTSEPTASIAGYNINNVAPLSPYGGDVESNEIRY